MANSYNTNPILLDTATAATLKNSGCTLTNRFRIIAIHWNNNKVTGTDQCILQDGAGNTVYSEFATSAGFFPLSIPLVYDDLKLARIDSGILFLYIL